MKSLQGKLLVASPHLTDPNFYRSVVLMVQHDSEGALGLILNRPTSQTTRDAWRAISDELIDSCAPVYYGGPVDGPLSAIHSNENCSETEIVPGVFFSAGRDQLSNLMRQEESRIRVFAGYSGWGGGQLEAEFEVGGWLSACAEGDTVFGDDTEIWKSVVQQIGLAILEPSLKHQHVPADPSVN